MEGCWMQQQERGSEYLTEAGIYSSPEKGLRVQWYFALRGLWVVWTSPQYHQEEGGTT